MTFSYSMTIPLWMVFIMALALVVFMLFIGWMAYGEHQERQRRVRLAEAEAGARCPYRRPGMNRHRGAFREI